MKPILALVACALLCFTGCPWTKPDTTQGQVAKIAVQYATARYIGRIPESERPARVQRIAEVVDAVESAAKGSEAVTIPLLQAALLKNLPSDLNLEDRIAISALTELVLAELSGRLSDGLLKEDQLLAVTAVAAWVRQACELYG